MDKRSKNGRFSKQIEDINCYECATLFTPYKKYAKFCTRKCFNEDRKRKLLVKKEVKKIKKLAKNKFSIKS